MTLVTSMPVAAERARQAVRASAPRGHERHAGRLTPSMVRGVRTDPMPTIGRPPHVQNDNDHVNAVPGKRSLAVQLKAGHPVYVVSTPTTTRSSSGQPT